jgi:long-chain fatty acid transport protein
LFAGIIFDKSLIVSIWNKQHISNLKTKHLNQTAGFLVVSSTLALLPGSVFGLGVALPDQDAFATARGNAFVATADDPAAVYYNPAGISQLQGMNTSVGAYGINYGSTFRGAESLDSKNQWALLPQVFSTYSIPKYNLTLGLGTYSPYGLRMEWPPFSPLVGEETGQITYITVNPVVAYQICPALSIAAGPTLNYSQAELKESPTVPVGYGEYLKFNNQFVGRDIAAGYNVGILWHPWEQHYLGVTYRSATDMNYDGHATIPPTSASQSAQVNFHFPQTIDFGYSYRPTKDWNVEADAVWSDWSTLQTVTVNPLVNEGPLAKAFDTLNFDWQSSWMLDFGVTRYLGDGWRVSGGYMYSMNSVPSSTYNPLVPDSDRHIFSIGVGKRYKKFSWDAGYQLAWGPSRTVSGDTFPGDGITSADGKYEFLSNALTINFGYHF